MCHNIVSEWSRCATARYGSYGTHGTNQRNIDMGSRNVTPVDRAHTEETGYIAFLARTCLVISPAFFSCSSCRLAAQSPSCVPPKPKAESVCGWRGFEPSGGVSLIAGEPDVVAGQTKYQQVGLG